MIGRDWPGALGDSMPRIVAALSFAFILSAPAFAQAPSSGQTPAPSPTPGAGGQAKAPPSEAARQVARDLIPKDKWDRLLDGVATGLSQQVGAALVQSGEKPPKDLEAKLRSQLGDEMKYEQTVDTQAQALGHSFSNEELKAIAKFYETPAGKKLVVELPRVQSEVSDALQARLSEAVPRVVQKVAPGALASKQGAGPGRPGESGTGSGAPAPDKGESPSPQGRPPPPAQPQRQP
jgi:uncharacterized protein